MGSCVNIDVQVELEFGSAGFYGGRKIWKTLKKPLGARTEPTTSSTHVPTTGTEPGSQGREVSALTATPTLLPTNVKKGDCRKKVKQRDCLNLVNDMKIKKGDRTNLLHKSQIGVGGLKGNGFVSFWSELG